MEAFIVSAIGGAILLLVLLVVCALIGLRLLQRIAYSLSTIPELKAAMESVAKANADAAATASDALRRTVGELDRTLQDSNHQMQSRYEAALRQLAQTADRFQSTITDHLQRLGEYEAKHASAIEAALAAAERESAQAIARASDAIRQHVYEMREVSGKAAQLLADTGALSTTRLTEIIARFEKTVEQQTTDGTVIANRHLEIVEATGTHMGNAMDAASKEFGRILREQEQRVLQQAAALRSEIAGVSAALMQLKDSLEEAVKF
jgi:ElaB/YqjD/DUF883 family membrane-anchored ribosome-binding protein